MVAQVTHTLESTYLTRVQLAKATGLSVRQIMNWETQRKFSGPTIKSKGGKTKDGKGKSPLYAPEKLHELKKRLEESQDSLRTTLTRREDSNVNLYSAEEAQKAFVMLRSGRLAVDLVTDLGLHPQAVKDLMRDYAGLSCGLYVEAEILEQVHKLPLDGCFPIEDSRGLLELLEGCAQEKCVSCKERPKSVCQTCAKRAVR
jgi:hypothetical protein